MKNLNLEIPNIPEDEMTETVKFLFQQLSLAIEIINNQAVEIQQLKDEIARLKGNPPKPNIRPSRLENSLDKKSVTGGSKRKNSSRKRSKNVKIDKTVTRKVTNRPKGAKTKGYREYTVQNISVKTENILYRLENIQLPDGSFVTANLPDSVKGHFGIELQQYILYMSYEMNISQSKIKTFLEIIGIDISDGEVNNILIKDKEKFHEEKENILEAGLETANFLVTDDTGARHGGDNGYANHIGNDFFAYFSSSDSKSRINFLKILRGKHIDYILNEASTDYIKKLKISNKLRKRLSNISFKTYKDKDDWDSFVKKLGDSTKKQIKILTEAALIGSIVEHGFNTDLVILSDEAGQFNVFLHSLCWIHAERKINRIIPINDLESEVIKTLEGDIWEFYQKLKAYKKNPNEAQSEKLSMEFDCIINKKSNFEAVNKALDNLYSIKKYLLLVLERPEIPLNNNISENDIRIYVTKRKVLGGTRSEDGRKSRDTFLSLTKTCKKLGLSFMDYLHDRLSLNNEIPSLDTIIRRQIICRENP